MQNVQHPILLSKEQLEVIKEGLCLLVVQRLQSMTEDIKNGKVLELEPPTLYVDTLKEINLALDKIDRG